MKNVFYEGTIMWSQIDANMHLRHSAYADFAAQARLELLQKAGISDHVIQKLKIGPILFREESIYLREIRASDTIKVTCELVKCRPDGSRWSFRQEIYRGDGVKSAVINVDGAWIDTEKRKLAVLPEQLLALFFSQVPQSEDFEWLTPKMA